MSASDRINTVEAHQYATFEKYCYRGTDQVKDDFFVNHYNKVLRFVCNSSL